VVTFFLSAQVISDEDLKKLLDRSDLMEKWEQMKREKGLHQLLGII
jgi:hypothetical protein